MSLFGSIAIERLSNEEDPLFKSITNELGGYSSKIGFMLKVKFDMIGMILGSSTIVRFAMSTSLDST